MKKQLIRGIAFTAVALVGLVPIQGASALAGELDVVISVTGGTDPEVAQVVTGHPVTLTATNDPAPTADATVNFDTDGDVLTVEETCTIPANETSCSVVITEAADEDVRAWISDGGLVAPCLPVPAEDADCDSSEGQDATAEPGATAEPDDTDVVTVEYLEGTLDVEDEDTAVSVNSPVTLTATVMSTEDPPRGLLANVDMEIISGPNSTTAAGIDDECDTNQAGSCDLTYTTGPDTGTDEVRSWIDENDDPAATPETGDETEGDADVYEADDDETTVEGTTDEPDNTDTVSVSISPAPQLTAAPRTQTKDVTQTATITPSLTTGSTPENAKRISATVISGPNVNKALNCNTGVGGTCTLSYTGTTAGTDNVRLWWDEDQNGQPNEADTGETFTSDGSTPDPDTTVVVQVVWTGGPGPTPTPTPTPDPQGPNCPRGRDSIRGTKGNDKIKGSATCDKIRGLKGNDKIKGRAGDDRLVGGPGNDRLVGGPGFDVCSGNKGKDKFKGCEKIKKR